MNITDDGKLTITQKERDRLEKAPLHARHIVLHHPTVAAHAKAITEGCAAIERAVDEHAEESDAQAAK